MNRFEIYYYNNTWDRFFAESLNLGLPVHCQLRPKNDLIRELNVTEDEVYSAFRRCLVLKDNQTNLFHVINHHDKCYSHLSFIEFLKRPDFGVVFQCQYRGHWDTNWYSDQNVKIYPFVYLEQDPWKFRKRRGQISPRRSHGPLTFRGSIVKGDGRKLREPFLTSIEDLLILDWKERLPEDMYYQELADAELALSVPGNGNFCHRELECFGIGTPVIMPRLLNSYYHPLIPDHHYVSVDINWETDLVNHKEAAFRERYNSVVGKTEYLRFVANNAREWYDQNVLYPARIILEVLNGG